MIYKGNIAFRCACSGFYQSQSFCATCTLLVWILRTVLYTRPLVRLERTDRLRWKQVLYKSAHMSICMHVELGHFQTWIPEIGSRHFPDFLSSNPPQTNKKTQSWHSDMMWHGCKISATDSWAITWASHLWSSGVCWSLRSLLCHEADEGVCLWWTADTDAGSPPCLHLR